MTALFPGSFDPVTLGHRDLLARAAGLFDHIVVAVLHNPVKNCLFSIEERLALLRGEIADMNISGCVIETDAFSGLLASYAKKRNARYIVRGLRSEADFAYEFAYAHANSHIAEELETLFLVSNPKFAFLSSKIVREAAQVGYGEKGASMGAVLEAWVSERVEQALRDKFITK
jgi:pantetheine-phosphate adenylyltransferase